MERSVLERNQERMPHDAAPCGGPGTEAQAGERAVREQPELLVDGTATIAGWSAGARAVLGWRDDEAIGRPLARLIADRSAAEVGRLIGDVVAGIPAEPEMLVFRTKDGPAVPLLLRAATRLHRGSAVAVVVTLAHAGLTGWGVAEHDDLDLEQMAAIGTWEWSFRSGRMTWSRQLVELHGEPAEPPESGLRRLLAAAHPDDRPELWRLLQRAALGGTPVSAGYRLLRADGGLRHAHLHAEVHCDADGVATALVGYVQDMTARLPLEDAVERGPEAAQQADAALARQLGARQREVLALLADGLGTSEIAARLFLSESTVKWHVKKILRALHAANRAEAVARYLRATTAVR